MNTHRLAAFDKHFGQSLSTEEHYFPDPAW